MLFILFFSKSIFSSLTQKKVFQSKNLPAQLQENTNITYVQSSEGEQIPVPKGYTASQIEGETSEKEGFVIYEGEIDWSQIKTENASNHENTSNKSILQLQATVNQYVWVPVEEEEFKTIYGIDYTGKLWGKAYTYTSSGRTPSGWEENNGKIKVDLLNKYIEPGIGYGANELTINEMTLKTQLNKSRRELISKLEQNYYQMIKSIKKYGGFYLGRYETGILENKAVIRKMVENLSNQSWAQMYQKTEKLKEEKDHITTSMIWGSLWDFTIQWLVNTGGLSNQTVSLSETWGNYRSSVFQYYTDSEGNQTTKQAGSSNAKIIPAGSSDYTKVNNIYDLAGNVRELTLESYGYSFVTRGGDFNSSTTAQKSCAYRTTQTIEQKTEKTGSRAILLLK